MRRRSDGQAPRQEPAKWQIEVPSDPVNEQVILAAMIADDEVRARLVKAFPPDAFFAEPHRAVAAGLGELERRKLAYDPAVVQRLHPGVDPRVLEMLQTSRPDVPQNLDFHVEMLAWDWRRAQVTKGPLSQLIGKMQDAREERERVRAAARAVADALEDSVGRARYLRDGREVIREAMVSLRQRVDGMAIFPFGIKGLDEYEQGAKDAKGKDISGEPRLVPGARPRTMSMITALSGSGKSTTSGHVILGQRRQGRKVLVGAWEEVAPVTIQLLATLELGWSRSRILNGRSNRLDAEGRYAKLSHEELVVFEEKMHDISKHVTFFDNPFQRATAPNGRRPTNDHHLDIIHEHIADSGADFFIADLFSRALIDDSPSAERQALFRMLAITEEQRVHTCMVHQQRAKDIEARVDKRPTREGIIGAGAWLDVCWTVIAPHLPAKWKSVPDDKIEFYVLKQRDGAWPLAVEMDWDPDTGQISGGRSVAVKAVETSEDGAYSKSFKGKSSAMRKRSDPR